MSYFGDYLMLLARQEHKEGSTVFKYIFFTLGCVGSRGLVDTVPVLGTRGVGRTRSNPTKYLAKKIT